MRILLIVLALASSSSAWSAQRNSKGASPPSRARAILPLPDEKAATDAFVAGDYDRAISLYTTLLASPRLAPTDREGAYLNRGYAKLRLGRRDEAAADLRQAIALNPAGAEAASALYALQNRSTNTTTPPSPLTARTDAAGGWGPLARLPGKYWIVSTTKPVSYMHYEWGRVGVSLIFGGKDAAGNRIEGQYFIDPATNAIRVNSTHGGKTNLADVSLSPNEFTTSAPGRKKSKRQIAQLQPDGTFNIVTQKPKGGGWETVSIATLVPTTEQMVTAMAWPDEPPPRESFLHGMLNSMKEGALAGLRDGAQQGVQDAVRHRVGQITGTPKCRTESGQVVRCP